MLRLIARLIVIVYRSARRIFKTTYGQKQGVRLDGTDELAIAGQVLDSAPLVVDLLEDIQAKRWIPHSSFWTALLKKGNPP